MATKRNSQISDAQMDKFVWQKGDIELVEDNYIFPNLKPIIDNMPKDGEAAFAYLQKKVRDNEITTEEFRYILRIGGD